tara:strand:+ start:11846 stop:13702 length:1857 start_codon:yes stop_codon:yes gene_type:complete
VHKIIFLYLLFIFQSLSYSSTFYFENIPIQDAGRVKPIDTYAEKTLLSIYERRALKDPKISASDWLIESIVNSDEAYSKNIFKIKSKDIANALDLDWRDPHYYSYTEISNGINNNIDYFIKLYLLPDDQKTVVEKQLSNLFSNIGLFKSITNSFTCLDKSLTIYHPEIVKQLGINSGDKISYVFYFFNKKTIDSIITTVSSGSKLYQKTLQDSLLKITSHFDNLKQNKFKSDPFYRNYNLKIIPTSDVWVSPWELLDNDVNIINNDQKKLLMLLEEYLEHYKNNDIDNMRLSASSYLQIISNIDEININNIKRETRYNQSDSFYYSIVMYIMAFLVLGISWIVNSKYLLKLAFFLIIIGFGYHGYGLLNRMIIMQRPPVTTLYESILFVGFVGVLFSIIFERFRKDGIGILLASVAGASLHFVGFGYENDGETLGVLVAVLNSNFWLATHVTTISIGYGATAVASIMGHVYYLVRLANTSSRAYLRDLTKNMLILNLIALFFMLFGTILGGIWADQSWGRFWGWDPKENAALLIVMWQILIIHLRITGLIKPLEFAFGMIISNIFLAFGWFGVNLLGVGLHSYGFTDSIATNLALFILFELWFAIGIYFLIKDTDASR